MILLTGIRMKILIGTPINVCKNYAMERWLENVSKLQREYPADSKSNSVDFLMVDNSPGFDYIKRVKGYCTKYGITNYRIEHLEINQQQPVEEIIGRSIEIIRQEVLDKDYDAWFSWECDQLIPANALSELIKMMESGNFTIASHSTWVRVDPSQVLDELFGTTLIKREVLEKISFIPEMPDTWEPTDKWFRKQVLKDGGSTIEADGVLKPVYHLEDNL